MVEVKMPEDFPRVIAKAWADEAFKARLLSDPATVLKEEGLPVPEGLTLKVFENTDSCLHIVLPQKPSEELSDESLSNISGGNSVMCTICLVY